MEDIIMKVEFGECVSFIFRDVEVFDIIKDAKNNLTFVFTNEDDATVIEEEINSKCKGGYVANRTGVCLSTNIEPHNTRYYSEPKVLTFNLRLL